MLIEFSVTNFRSFRERQTFSMVAAPRLRKKDNTFVPQVTGEKLPPLLKVAAIYGPNASGKSNLLLAFDVVRRIAAATPSNAFLPANTFRFDPELANQPSRFEVNFIAGRQRYQFELAVTSERIVEEKLTAYPRGRETVLYERLYTDNREHYDFGLELEGGEDLHEAWRKLTGPKTLFMSQAVANSSEELGQLRVPHKWLVDSMFVVSHGMKSLAAHSQSIAHKYKSAAEQITSFLRDVDVPVVDLRVEKIQMSGSSTLLTGLASDGEVPTRDKTTLTHRTALGDADFDFSEESEGTQSLIGFWLPWSIMVEKEGVFDVLAVDELDSSLHPQIVAMLVAKYLAFEQPNQLIFSTHDTHLMDTKLLRRDQIWITERDANGATQLRSVHDFDGRESEDVEKRYYEGRYRGLPIIRKR